jgi:hypothetical protein
MEQMGRLHEKLQTMVGEEQAVKLLAETLENA